LPKNIKKYILFGNHEIEDNTIDIHNPSYNKKKTYEELKPLVESCKSLILQTTNRDSIFDDSYQFFNDVITIIRNKTLIIMFDTTMYTFKEKEGDFEKKINETCYQHLFKNIPNITGNSTIRELMIYQENKIIDAINLNNTCKNIIFIGHHPIAYMVNKKEVKKGVETKENIFDHNYKIINFFNNMYEILKNKNIYYLCADTHFYDYSEITITKPQQSQPQQSQPQQSQPQQSQELLIRQYIVGSGGADLDKLPIYKDNIIELTQKHITIDKIPIKYNIIEHKRTFGFITVDIQQDDKISIKYHDTEEASKSEEFKSEEASGGYLKKYLKYKAKYLQLKQLKENL